MSVSVDIDVVSHLSYAMAHNQLPVIRDIRVRNSGEELLGAELTLEVRDTDGPVSRPWNVRVDLPAGSTATLSAAELRLDPSPMLQVADERPATVVATVLREDGSVAGGGTASVRLLPGTLWRAVPPGLAYELLPSFVLPNDPAVLRLLEDAAEILLARTGSPSLQGYQSGEERVDQIAAAIWSAAQAREIRYAEPPASWGSVGQKVRTPTVVLEDRIGTCLDTTVVLAAALEQAGVRPLLWVIDGHAFLGYWRVERALDAICYPDATDLMNEIDLGLIRLIETTAVTKSADPVPFEDTHRLALRAIQDADVVRGVVDVWTARMAGVLPLPARRVTDEGVQVVEYQASTHSPRTVVIEHSGDDRAHSDQRSDTPPRVQSWKNSLLDLSLRNRLINYTERSGLSLVVPEQRIGTLEDLISAGRPIALKPSDQIDQVDRGRGVMSAGALPAHRLDDLLLDKQAIHCDVGATAYQTRMRGLAYKARTIVEETGANNLYLALGSLTWSLDNRALRSPLVLVPIRLTTTARGQLYRIELDESGASTPNYCLLEKLRQSLGIEFPELENPDLDDSGIDLDGAFAAVRRTIAQKGLPFRVEETAHVAILQFAKFRLWKDLDEHWSSFTENSLVNHLIHTPAQEYVDPVTEPASVDLDALDSLCPIPADASQLGAVAAAVAGRTFVLQGPPGTGKSQTITNLLSRAVAEGKRVLFVAEKRAALDVVQARLESVGMGPFSLDLHDKGSKPATVRSQILNSMDQNVSVDEQWLGVQQDDLSGSRRALARYAQLLHDQNAAGLSLYTARTRLLALGLERDVLEVPQSLLSDSRKSDLDSAREALRRLPDVAGPAAPSENHPWGFVRLSTPDDTQRLDEVLRAAASVQDSVERLPVGSGVRNVLQAASTAEDVATLASIMGSRIGLDTLDRTRTEGWRSESARVTAEIAAFVAAAHPGLDVATPAALDLPLADIHAQAQAAASSGFFGRRKRLRAVLNRLQPTLRPEATVSHKQVVELTSALVQLQAAVRALANRAHGLVGVDLPESWNPLTEQGRDVVESQTRWLAWAGDAVSGNPGGQDFRTSLRHWMADKPQVQDEEAAAVSRLSSSLVSLSHLTESSSEDMASWSGAIGLVERWQRTAGSRRLGDDDLLTLRRMVHLNQALEPLSVVGMKDAAARLRSGAVDHAGAMRAFERGVATASVLERQRATGLDVFDPEAHERAVQRFAESARAVRAEMSAAVPRSVLDNRTFDASSERGQVGELRRELGKQRRALGVRGLMHRYGDLITRLMPCVLVSPDSVARFFPVGSQVFDIVVFDEASQIRVADAIGAMGRAEAVVVVGDSKQMPPTMVAEAVSDMSEDLADEATEPVLEDAESILSEADAARVPSRWLTWHYRSQDESLIAFSNHHYYESKLSSFPAPVDPQGDRLRAGRGISLVRVEGTFLRSGSGKTLRTNPVEAERIVADVKRRFDESPDATPSLGIVTFNQQQRAHIEALIRDSGDERLVAALDDSEEEGIFIKNLENVQGDERDVILFSTAFSVNDKGVLPLNFGPLTRAGGERRLNVAITRARRQVVLYSSFDPSQLRVEETQSRGIQHLKAYLELAQHGPEHLTRSTSIVRAVRDLHRDQIADALRDAGVAVTTDVGLSDFRIDLALATIDRPRVPLVAVLLDGPGWASRRTVADRDGLPVEVLGRMMRWPGVERVWMPDWIARPDEVVAGLVKAVGSADEAAAADVRTSTPEPSDLRSARPSSATPSVAPTAEVLRRSPAESPTEGSPAQLTGERPYVPFVARRYGGREVLDALPAHWAAEQVRRAIRDVVATEAPVHFERLARLVAACFDLSRLNESRIRSILAVVPSEYLTDPDEPFVWPVGVVPANWLDFRVGGEARSLDHVSLREIGNAMTSLCRQAAGMDHDELTSETLALFGGRRRTAGVAARLQAARELVVTRGLLLDRAGRLYVAD